MTLLDDFAAKLAAEEAAVHAELERVAAKKAALALLQPDLAEILSVPMTPGAVRGNGGRFVSAVKVEPVSAD